MMDNPPPRSRASKPDEGNQRPRRGSAPVKSEPARSSSNRGKQGQGHQPAKATPALANGGNKRGARKPKPKGKP